jgi:hypothetical protein
MGDEWLGPDTCGVSLAGFEAMTAQMRRAAPALDDCATQMHAILASAGVSTAPAAEIRRIADWARSAATDLQRRNVLAHNLDRQKLGMGVCTVRGDYLVLPDRYTDQLPYADALETADLLKRAAKGDQVALEQLQQFRADATNPTFAKTLLSQLGAKGLVELPGQLVASLPERLKTDSTKGTKQAAQVRAVLAMLSGSLAQVTDPKSSGYLGATFEQDVMREGAALHKISGMKIPGYASIGTLLVSTPAGVHYSPEFMRTIGQGVVAWDDRARTELGGGHGPPPDLAGTFNLGNLLSPARDNPNAPASSVPPDCLARLVELARYDKATAQAFLGGSPPDWPSTRDTFMYLIRDRREQWALEDKGAVLGELIKLAAMGKDKASQQIFEQAVRVLGREARTFISSPDQETLSIADKTAMDQLSGMRRALADVLISHLDDINTAFFGDDTSGRGNPDALEWDKNLSALLADVVQNDDAFQALTKAEIGHLRLWLDHRYAAGQGTDTGVAIDAQALGYLLALRKEAMTARGEKAKAENAEFKALIDAGIGELPIPYANVLGKMPLYEETVKDGYAKVGDWLAKHAGDQSEAGNTASKRLKDEDAVINLTKQMLFASAVNNLKYDPSDLRGESFAKNGKVIPPSQWSKTQLDAFINWCRRHDHPAPLLSKGAEDDIRGAHGKAMESMLGQGSSGK